VKVSRCRRNRVLKEIIAINVEEGRLITPDHPRLVALKMPALERVLEKLAALKLITLRYADNEIHLISLNSDGFVYFERRSDEIWQFVRRSILVPIAVSAATTAIGWVIKYLITGSWL